MYEKKSDDDSMIIKLYRVEKVLFEIYKLNVILSPGAK